MVGIWNPDKLESGIQRVGIQNPEGRNPEFSTSVDSVTCGDSK